jgi:hypothetical protein
MEQRAKDAQKKLEELTAKAKADLDKTQEPSQEGEGAAEPAAEPANKPAEPENTTGAPEPGEGQNPEPPLSVDYKEAYRRLKSEASEKLKREQQRFRTLEGKYKSETQRLREELETRETVKPTPETDPAFKILVDTIGDEDEALTVWKSLRPQKETATPTDLVEGFVEAPGQAPEVDDEAAGLTRDQFFSTLDTELPGWDVVQESSEFVSWARENVDPVTGRTLYSVIASADKANDPQPIINIVANFVRYDEAQKLKARENRPPLDVTPEVQQVGGTGEPPKEEKRFSRSDAAKWPKLYARGELTKDQYNGLLVEFSKALQNGRVDA